ncbi:MAG: 50S ribosomal protein L4 [Proteobacteria bacterium]|nr:50S ribosomal protein L4 [Pseudomonadota bacterium]
MKAEVITLDGKKAGDIDLADAIYGLEKRADILHRVVKWQLAKRRAGTHAVKFRSDIRGTTKRVGKQKGGGTARHGNRKVNIFRGGGRAFGPIVRDHGYSLPKKIRALGLKTALSVKQLDKKIIVIDAMDLKEAKTAALVKKLGKLGLASALFVDGAEVNENFKLALANIPNVDVLPSQGLNVYDILRRDTLVLTKAAVEKIEERLK